MTKKTVSTPSISIIVPCYSEADRLQACLESIAKQTLAPDEVIVVDNNSTDESVAIASSFKFVTVLHEPLQGLVHARNKGLNHATSDILTRIDSDSVLPDHWVEKVVSLFTDGSVQAVTGPGYYYDMPCKRLLNALHVLLYFRYNKLICGSYLLWGSNMALTRTVWNRIKSKASLDTSIAEDMDLSLLIARGDSELIHFDRSLYQDVSFRNGKEGLVHAWQYLLRWPKAFRGYSRRSYYGAWFIIVVGIIILAPVLFPLGLYSKITKKI